jgi:hypothetical protein
MVKLVYRSLWLREENINISNAYVIDQKGGKFKVQSTVFPSKLNHLGNYKALVRNNEGSEELTVILYGYGKIMYFHSRSDCYNLID